MQILWTVAAARDLDSIEEFVSQDNPPAALQQVLQVIHTVERHLLGMPHLGRAGRVPGTRELIIPDSPYLVAYRVRQKTLEILRVLHHAHRWPTTFCSDEE